MYCTKRNARYIYTARCLIEAIDPDLQHFLLAPLLAEASMNVNTSGVFKGFYKDGNGSWEVWRNQWQCIKQNPGRYTSAIPGIQPFRI
ncbi:MAG: hypothetical protein B6D68_03525 [spirochete symbiont of Stewartia floridana]|nr:MAG: hypothetical protein B6D68_03525 [spirochete symbiont of Stewartia floridana]